MFSIDWKGLALPFAYLLVLSGALMTFSTIYRKRKAGTFSRSLSAEKMQTNTNTVRSGERKPGTVVRAQSPTKRLPFPFAHGAVERW